MSAFAVIAELPLGAYRARTPGGHLDPMPSPARLHAALLCAAASGPRATAAGNELQPSALDLEVLHWLEEHPPDGVHLPRTSEVRTGTYAYRKEGTIKKEGKKAPQDKVVKRPMVGLVAVDGPFAWTWSSPPPEPVQSSLEALCADVAFLGNADTPVRLRLGTAKPTHTRDEQADLFASAEGLDIDVASPGRTAALTGAYAATRKAPSASVDRWTSSGDEPRPSPLTTEAREPVRYVQVEGDPEPAAPWGIALLAGLGIRPARDDEHVGWAVALHRALIGVVGDGAPAVLTGAYLEGAPRPANRVALQLLAPDAVATAEIDHDGPVLAVLVPTDAEGADVAVVADAFSRLSRMSWGRRSARLTPLPARSARAFWPQRKGDAVFEARPAMVADTRPVDRSWTMGDAVALAAGLVLRDRTELQGPGRGAARYRETASRVRDAGLHVHAVERVAGPHLGRYVHRIHDTRVVQPFRARLSLGGLLSDRALVCLGQSRHLGGGLLVPVTSTDREA